MVSRKKIEDEGLLNLQTNEELSSKTMRLEEQLEVTNKTLGALRGRISYLVDEITALKRQMTNTQDTFAKHLVTLAKKIEPTHKW